jgi:hypothetical protein
MLERRNAVTAVSGGVDGHAGESYPQHVGERSTTTRTTLSAGVAGGVVGFIVAWLVLARTNLGEAWELVWGGSWFGVWTGVGAAVAYAAVGGRTWGGVVLSAALAALAVLAGVFAYAFVASLGDGPFAEALLGALVVFVFWALPLAIVLLVGPAVVTALALGGAAALVRRVGARPLT